MYSRFQSTLSTVAMSFQFVPCCFHVKSRSLNAQTNSNEDENKSIEYDNIKFNVTFVMMLTYVMCDIIANEFYQTNKKEISIDMVWLNVCGTVHSMRQRHNGWCTSYAHVVATLVAENFLYRWIWRYFFFVYEKMCSQQNQFATRL